MQFTTIIAIASALAPLVLAAPAPGALNEPAFDLVAREDFRKGKGKSGLKITVFEGKDCTERATLHSNVEYNFNYADGKIQSYKLDRGLKADELLDFSGKADKKVRDVDNETSPLEDSLLEKRKLEKECAKFHEHAPKEQPKGCHNIPEATCIRLFKQ